MKIKTGLALTLCLVLTLTACGSGDSPRPPETLELQDRDFGAVDRVSLRNIQNGLTTEITDPEDLTCITDFLSRLSGTGMESQKEDSGGLYCLTACQGDREVLTLGFYDDDHFTCGTCGDGCPARYRCVATDSDRIRGFLTLFDDTVPRKACYYLGRWYPADQVSPDTLRWLKRYNCLTETEQLAISYVPPEFVKAGGIALETTDP